MTNESTPASQPCRNVLMRVGYKGVPKSCPRCGDAAECPMGHARSVRDTPASQLSPRLIPDAECARSKCAFTTSGCYGVCNLKHNSASSATIFVASQPSQDELPGFDGGAKPKTYGWTQPSPAPCTKCSGTGSVIYDAMCSVCKGTGERPSLKQPGDYEVTGGAKPYTYSFSQPSPARSDMTAEGKKVVFCKSCNTDRTWPCGAAQCDIAADFTAQAARSDMPDKKWYSKMAEKELEFDGNIEAGSDMPDTEREAIGEVKLGAHGKLVDWYSSEQDLYALPVGTKIYIAAQAGLAERTPSSDTVATWQERMGPGYIDGGADLPEEVAMKAEIADLRAALARRATAGTQAAPSEASRVMRALIEDVAANPKSAEGYIKLCLAYFERATAGTTAPEKCVICGSDEPRTGTCGSSDPRALCNAAPSVAGTTAPAPADFGFAVMEHLGPAALAGGKISVYDAFKLGWDAKGAATAVPGDLPPLPKWLIEGAGRLVPRADAINAVREYGKACLASNAGVAPLDIVLDYLRKMVRVRNYDVLSIAEVGVTIAALEKLYLAPSNSPVGAQEKEQ